MKSSSYPKNITGGSVKHSQGKGANITGAKPSQSAANKTQLSRSGDKTATVEGSGKWPAGNMAIMKKPY